VREERRGGRIERADEVYFPPWETVRAPGVPEPLPGRAENVFGGHC